MNIRIKKFGITLCASVALLSSCQEGDRLLNPNVATRATPTLVLNNLTANLAMTEEQPFSTAHRTSQFVVSNYSYYWGTNFYNWANTEHRYDIIRYAVKLEEEAARQYGEEENVYLALAKFFRAYSGVWLSQRVGDIPFSEAGSPDNLTPRFDSQEEVYRQVLALLEDANTMLGNLTATSVAPNNLLDENGDIFRLTNKQWQKTINAYRLRVLVSLSKRASDTPALGVAEKVSVILNNPSAHPLPESNADNLVYRYNLAFNPYSMYNARAYAYGINISKTILDITSSTLDPRTFIFATPAPEQYIAGGKPYSDFTAYVGASTNTPQADLFSQTDAASSTTEDRGAYSYINYRRYFTSQDGSTTEHNTLLSYAETCFNVAEAMHRGWTTGNAEEWYLRGINASLSLYGIQDGATLTVSDRLGNSLGTVTVDLNSFLNHPDVTYKGGGDAGLEQIVTQKYVSLFCQAGYEGFYNYLRTGYPAFQQGGPGIGTSGNQIAKRWMYPQNEISYNNENYTSAIQRQYNGQDNTMLSTWLYE